MVNHAMDFVEIEVNYEPDLEILFVGDDNDHTYAAKCDPPSKGRYRVSDVHDRVLIAIFKTFDLKERTKMERVCWRWGSLIPPLAHRHEFYPPTLSTSFELPKIALNASHKLSNAYLSLFKKCPGFKRLTTEYVDAVLFNDTAKMKALCIEFAERRPDIEEIVIETRSAERFKPQRAMPVDMTKMLIYELNCSKSNIISSAIVYTEDWSQLNIHLMPIVTECPRLTSLTIIFTSRFPDDFPVHHMSSCWTLLAPSLRKLKLIWNESPHHFGFESILVNLQELTFKPSIDQFLECLMNMKNLTKLSFVGNLKLFQSLTENSDKVPNLCQIIWIDVDKKSDEDFRIFYDKPSFNHVDYDQRVDAKEIFDQFFVNYGPRLKLLHLTVHQLNILHYDLLSNINLSADSLLDIKLDFHRRCDMDLAFVVLGLANLRKLALGFRNPIDYIALRQILDACHRLRKVTMGLIFKRKGPQAENGEESENEEEADVDEEVELTSSESSLDMDMDGAMEDEEEEEEEQEVIQIDSDDDPLSAEDQIKTFAVDAFCEYRKRHPKRHILAKLIAQFPFRNKFQQSFQKNIIIEETGVTDGRVVVDLLNPTESD